MSDTNIIYAGTLIKDASIRSNHNHRMIKDQFGEVHGYSVSASFEISFVVDKKTRDSLTIDYSIVTIINDEGNHVDKLCRIVEVTHHYKGFQVTIVTVPETEFISHK